MFNVKRGDEVPASLAARRSYKDEDVVKALERAFHKKCYLCETKEPQDINVEHFVAHQNNDDLKYDWSNLYFSCGRCNNIKLQYFNNLLDCCAPNQDVFREIKLLPPRTPGARKLVVERQSEDARSVETEQLLEKIYNSDHTVNKAVTGSYLRKKINTQFALFHKWLNVYYAEDALEAEREDALERIQVLMSDQSQYSAFIKWCILDDEDLNELLGPLIN
ncbi:conserved hypothetical protein [Shewanella halifaxensis HAW-EB4]|uniref:HNH domain-containing protein n=1 Tax=Shewanella halifaxensis (strain HAW-EB4) TaxID=458817 RepID=B0TM53_SHEHH|nr:hypothetical protein [Shewanella halifaxensis]ABZ74646.1 conserved hypothetical protein [Shewanella halifaxensis HAW-EB4]